MYRYLSIAVLSFVCLGAAVPSESQAQTPVPVQVSPARVMYRPGYTYVAPGYIATAPVVVTPTVVVPRTVYYPRYYGGYRRVEYRHVAHYRHHR